jgi:hypothetical protein
MRIADALHRAARRLRAIVDRLRRRSLALAAAGLGVLACDHGATRLDLTAPAVAVAPAIDAGLEVAPPPPPAEEPIGRFQMTFYFIIHEAEMTPANDNAVAGSAVAGSAGGARTRASTRPRSRWPPRGRAATWCPSTTSTAAPWPT